MTEAELRVSEQAKRIVSGVLRSGGTAVDATAGNGHDTLFLSQTAGDCGQVLAFDQAPYVRKGGSLCERALEIIEQHYMDEDLSLASLSAMLDVSPNHLSACIKKSEGETFINILVRRRMETAQQLLLTTDLQIQEIARRCGYTDQHYFSYCFKKYSGTSPVALRRARAAGEAHA